MEPIPIAGPWITDKEVEYVADAARNAWYSNANEYTSRFEEAFRQYVGRKFAASLPSCTSGLHLSLAALGIGPRDEVIVPDTTWIATSAPISYVGADPVFADIDPVSWCLSAPSFEECITDRTRAAIVVDLYGNMPDMAAILEIARRRGVAIIEDAAEAIGSRYDGRLAGGFGVASIFSFHGSKTLTTGEGGMLVTDDETLFERCLMLRDHGRRPGDTMFFNAEVGFKYKMSSMQAAMGLAQLERIDELVERKRQVFRWYEEDLASIPGVVLNSQAPGVTNTYWMVTAVWPPELELPKETVMTKLLSAGIHTRPFFHPLSSIPAYRDLPQAAHARRRNTTAYRTAPNAINLPSALSLTRAQVEYVARHFRELFGR